MRGAPQRPRVALFCGCALALMLSAVLLGHGESAPNRPGRARPESGAARAIRPAPPAGLRRIAVRFLGAYFRYEVGETDGAVRRALRRTASAAFATMLLSQRPPAEPGAPAARLEQLSLALLTARPPRALISGAAARGGDQEQFSFLFEDRDGSWRASGPGQ